MKKLLFVSLSIVFVMIGTAFLLPYIKRVNSLPDEMVVTYSDIQHVNDTDEYSSLINFELPKNIKVATNGELTDTVMSIKLFDFFTIKKVNVRLLTDTDVYVGGETVGFNLFSEGVICVGSNAVATADGTKEPLKDSGLLDGDAIIKIEDIEIESIEDIDRIINLPTFAGKEISLTVKRGEQEIELKATPVFDVLSQKYKLGLWVRNNASGVGTLTYVKQSDFRFGAVGHPIVDSSLGENFEVESGNIYKCRLLGIKKGEKNNPGEIRSSINLSDDAIGLADTNCKYGVYGNILNKNIIDADRTATLGGRLGVKLGDAKIYCALDNEGVKAYDVKIIKANKQNSADDKSMTIKVTDKELLQKTGGIIQGMSGSPIVQNGKIVGAVTHVFVNDPTRGYGVYVDWMINN
ncbi:MAG: SpoIVB peptidase [Clostridiales bacterium]|nr:SpoIVB peptidase [Clostridiales bacterium]